MADPKKMLNVRLTLRPIIPRMIPRMIPYRKMDKENSSSLTGNLGERKEEDEGSLGSHLDEASMKVAREQLCVVRALIFDFVELLQLLSQINRPSHSGN